MDIDRLPPGRDFVEEIDRALGFCDVLIALIGRDWLTVTDARGHRRLENPEDYLRLEIEAALGFDIPVIPVLVQDAQMPNSDDLPDGLAPLARRQGVPLRDIGWREDVARLVRGLESIADAGPQRELTLRERAQPGPEVPEREWADEQAPLASEVILELAESGMGREQILAEIVDFDPPNRDAAFEAIATERMSIDRRAIVISAVVGTVSLVVLLVFVLLDVQYASRHSGSESTALGPVITFSFFVGLFCFWRAGKIYLNLRRFVRQPPWED